MGSMKICLCPHRFCRLSETPKKRARNNSSPIGERECFVLGPARVLSEHQTKQFRARKYLTLSKYLSSAKLPSKTVSSAKLLAKVVSRVIGTADGQADESEQLLRGPACR